MLHPRIVSWNTPQPSPRLIVLYHVITLFSASYGALARLFVEARTLPAPDFTPDPLLPVAKMSDADLFAAESAITRLLDLFAAVERVSGEQVKPELSAALRLERARICQRLDETLPEAATRPMPVTEYWS